MKKYIIGILIIVFLIAGCFYFVFSHDENLTITYIRFKVNPDFVIGINSKDKVVMYNPLNEDASIFNLGMFNNKSLDEVSSIFVSRVNENNYLLDNDVKLTVMTKNLEKRNRLTKIISDVIKKTNNSIIVNVLEPTSDELLAYSNEEVFDKEPTFNENDLVSIGNDIKNKVDLYVKDKINNLKLDKLSFEEQKNILELNLSLGYFSDFVITNEMVNYDILLSKRTSYQVTFTFNEDLTYSYNIILKLEFDYYQESLVEEKRIGNVEVYEYSFDTSSNVISDYVNHFYRFNY